MPINSKLLTLSLTLLLGPSAAAQDSTVAPQPEPDPFRKSLLEGRTWIDFRYRLEHVDAGNFSDDALASTLRTAVGFESAPYHGFQGMIEFEDVTVLGNDRLYDNGLPSNTVNRPIVSEVETTEIHQVLGRYRYGDRSSIQVGRQEIGLQNHRFIGITPWRQNHQSFDAVRIRHELGDSVLLDYSFLHNVNRPGGETAPNGDERMRTHALDIRHQIDAKNSLTGYVYSFDFDQQKQFNTLNFGARLKGEIPVHDHADLLYIAEYATQQDSGTNPVVGGIDTEYALVQLGARVHGVTLKVMNEHLGGSGNPGDKFSTPIASRHRQNGLADQFFITPDTGLEDRSIGLWSSYLGIDFGVIYHRFDADTGPVDYGSELDVLASYSINKNLGIYFLYADFQADSDAPAPFVDTQRFMTWVSYSLL